MTEETLKAAFIPFGEIVDVMIPMNYEQSTPPRPSSGCAALCRTAPRRSRARVRIDADPGACCGQCVASADKNRGFGFVEFEVREDAMAAQENMHNGELFGKVLSVNLARARNIDKNRAGTIFSSFTICRERLDQLAHSPANAWTQCGSRIRTSTIRSMRMVRAPKASSPRAQTAWTPRLNVRGRLRIYFAFLFNTPHHACIFCVVPRLLAEHPRRGPATRKLSGPMVWY